MKTISISEVKDLINKGVNSFSVKDNSIRGIKTASVYCYKDEIHGVEIGDKIVIDNHFTEITA